MKKKADPKALKHQTKRTRSDRERGVPLNDIVLSKRTPTPPKTSWWTAAAAPDAREQFMREAANREFQRVVERRTRAVYPDAPTDDMTR